MHLDIWTEFDGHFKMAEGELIRLLEFENLHYEMHDLPNSIVMGDFNAVSRKCDTSSNNHVRLTQLLDAYRLARDANLFRHTLPRGVGQRIRDEWCMSVFGFAESRPKRSADDDGMMS